MENFAVRIRILLQFIYKMKDGSFIDEKTFENYFTEQIVEDFGIIWIKVVFRINSRE